MSSTPAFFVTPKTIAARLQNSDGTSLVTVYTPPTAGAKIAALMAVSTDSAARDIGLFITKGGVDYPLCTVAVPITAGTIAATPQVNLINRTSAPGLPLDSDGQAYILLETGAVLKAKALVAITAATFMNIVGVAAEA